jgi:hypothetical protein
MGASMNDGRHPDEPPSASLVDGGAPCPLAPLVPDPGGAPGLPLEGALAVQPATGTPTATPFTVGAVVDVVVVLGATVPAVVAKSEDPHPAVASTKPTTPRAAATVRRGCRPTDPSISCTLSAPLDQVRVCGTVRRSAGRAGRGRHWARRFTLTSMYLYVRDIFEAGPAPSGT